MTSNNNRDLGNRDPGIKDISAQTNGNMASNDGAGTVSAFRELPSYSNRMGDGLSSQAREQQDIYRNVFNADSEKITEHHAPRTSESPAFGAPTNAS